MPKEDVLNNKNFEVWSRKARFLLMEWEVPDTIFNTVQEIEEGTMTQAQYRETYREFYSFMESDAIKHTVLLGTRRNDFMLRYERFYNVKEV